MRFPLNFNRAVRSLARGAHTVLVIHGPRDWSWAQVNSWNLVRGFAVAMCPPDIDPRDLSWSIVKGQEVLLLQYTKVFDEPRAMPAVLLASGCKSLHVVDLSSEFGLPDHYELENGQWQVWTGLGKRELVRRRELIKTTAADR